MSQLVGHLPIAQAVISESWGPGAPCSEEKLLLPLPVLCVCVCVMNK